MRHLARRQKGHRRRLRGHSSTVWVGKRRQRVAVLVCCRPAACGCLGKPKAGRGSLVPATVRYCASITMSVRMHRTAGRHPHHQRSAPPPHPGRGEQPASWQSSRPPCLGTACRPAPAPASGGCTCGIKQARPIVSGTATREESGGAEGLLNRAGLVLHRTQHHCSRPSPSQEQPLTW